MKKYKIRHNTVLPMIILILVSVLLLKECLTGNQASVDLLIPNSFEGEYSQADGPWIPLNEDTVLSALNGDLVLRGCFSEDMPEGETVNFYLNHLSVSISVNGEEIYHSSSPYNKSATSMCGKIWHSFVSPGIAAKDVVEIQLRNTHFAGNSDAYNEFLHSFYNVSEYTLRSYLENESQLSRTIGGVIMIISLMIIGIALGFAVMQLSFSRNLRNLGFFSLFAGGYIAMDNMDISLWSDLVVMNTYGLYLCIMLSVLLLHALIADNVTGRTKKAAGIAVTVESLMIILIVILCLTGSVYIYDTLPCWWTMQLILCPLFISCCLHDICRSSSKHKGMLISCAALLTAIFIDLINTYTARWPRGICSKIVFVLLFMVYVVYCISHLSASYQASIRAGKLAEELKNSRIVLAMSQIRTHFIFNVLNAISGMCKYDPEKADETVVRFSRYLRSNIDILQDDQPITFHADMQHLEDFVALEQVRFGDKLQFIKDINVDDFFIPPLVLQPIVENSIKHGLRPKPDGGTVTLRTWADKTNIYITVHDDGMGFDPGTVENDKSVGLSNVSFRLTHLMHGKLDIDSKPGLGTTVTITIPIKEAQPCT